MRIGIRREDKNEYEGRVPLVPEHCTCRDVVVQPSKIRTFSDDEYRAAGAVVQEDLSDCGLVLGVKEMPLDFFRENGAYMFFSHTIKGQDYNMPMLKKMMSLGCTLIDYEKITNEHGARLIAFGRYAGVAGMVDSLWAYGQWMGGPLSKLKQSIDYQDIGEAKSVLEGIEIKERLVVGFAGYGRVSTGAQEIFDVLKPETIRPDELPEFEGTLAKVVFREEDMVRPKAGGFVLNEYYSNPDNYEGDFRRHLPYLNILMNCIYWDDRYPRLVTKRDLSQFTNLKVIGDISCDINGAVEATCKATDPGNPVYTYSPKTGEIRDGLEGDGTVILAVDTLPSEFPREASLEFSTVLKGMLPDSMDGLPVELERAMILKNGKLTPGFQYLEKYL